jgi:hypothetical protein
VSQFLVSIAGFPELVVAEIKARSAQRFSESAAQPPIVYPLREPYIYSSGYASRYLTETASRLAGFNHSEYASSVLIYAEHRADQTNRFIQHFFPFTLVAGIEFEYLNAVERHERRQRLLTLVDKIEVRAGVLRNIARRLWDELGGNGFTPLLLPMTNFHSHVLGPKMQELFSQLSKAARGEPGEIATKTANGLLEAFTAELLKHHPKKVDEDGRYFEDDRALRFRSPGRDRHGYARDVSYTKGHNPNCLIGSRIRLGGHFDPLFHFDCDCGAGTALDRTYPNCHAVPTEPKKRTYVNIAPNDNIR